MYEHIHMYILIDTAMFLSVRRLLEYSEMRMSHDAIRSPHTKCAKSMKGKLHFPYTFQNGVFPVTFSVLNINFTFRKYKFEQRNTCDIKYSRGGNLQLKKWGYILKNGNYILYSGTEQFLEKSCYTPSPFLIDFG